MPNFQGGGTGHGMASPDRRRQYPARIQHSLTPTSLLAIAAPHNKDGFSPRMGISLREVGIFIFFHS